MQSERAKTIWQIVFLIGVSACLIAGSISLGALFTPLLASATAVLAVINSLLRPPTTHADVSGNWLASLLKKGLSVTWFLKLATIVIWGAALCFIGYQAVGSYRASQRISLEGYVMTAGGDPADEAVVTVAIKGRDLTTTTSKGKFSMEIDLAGIDRKSLSLQARWHGLETRLDVDVSVGPPKGVIITLPPGDMPLRVSYFLLGGFTIDFLMRGAIDKKWEEKLSGQPYIIPNQVFSALGYLVNSFSGAFDHDQFLLDRQTKTDEIISDIGLRSFFVGTWRPKYFDRPLSRNDLRSILDPRKSWNVEGPPSNTPSANLTSFRFWKFAERTDLASFSDLPHGYNRTSEWVRFYSYITRDYLPSDFCYVSMSPSFCGDVIVEQLYPRVLQLRVAVIENYSAHPVRIGKFLEKENATDRLRSRDADQRAFGNQGSTEAELFPPGILNPGEKILVPIEMSFVFDKAEFEELQQCINRSADATRRSEMLRHLSQPDAVKVPADDGIFEVTNTDVLNILNAPAQQLSLEREYTYGHSIRLESVEVDKVKYEFRKFDPTKLVLRGGDESGSCPYVFTYSTDTGAWRNEGEIIFGRRGKEKESVDQKELTSFDGRLLIKENDTEVSFLDSMYVRTTDANGHEIRLYPSNPRLKLPDGKYLTLTKGEQLEVHFELPIALIDRHWTLVVKGYYVPLKDWPSGIPFRSSD